MKAAGWSKHDRCLVCLNDIVEREARSPIDGHEGEQVKRVN